MSDGHLGKCKNCVKEYERSKRLSNVEKFNSYDKNRYRNNIERIFSCRYDGMRRRVLGLCKRGSTGKELLNEKEFIDWCHIPEVFNSFMDIYDAWVISIFERKLSPSIDRIDNSRGYTVDNLQWITQSENTKKFHRENRNAEDKEDSSET